ncbi:SDR family NAD(P)-dependent oxidoreductase, partial [Lactiplantibacillus plantarum]|uniref:SDR family NAD(P)-dependent oxidoreductase n=1 Tax=Lactiplantibacillus plantarum TaxID=1590 RepID=UPI0039BEF956
MMNALTSKVAVITGGSSGIGLATAWAFIAEGAVAVSADVNAPEDEQIDFVKTDVTDPASLKHMVDTIVAKYGHIDALVANAG